MQDAEEVEELVALNSEEPPAAPESNASTREFMVCVDGRPGQQLQTRLEGGGGNCRACLTMDGARQVALLHGTGPSRECWARQGIVGDASALALTACRDGYGTTSRAGRPGRSTLGTLGGASPRGGCDG
eukprot:scaffold7387_cov408-Prasinococcus_capsulatus_cf.AAC.10